MQRGLWPRIREAVRRYFVAGILAFAPLGITIWAIAWIIQKLDNLLLPGLLSLFYAGVDEAPRLPLVGALFTFVVIILMGVIARHFFGQEFVKAWERLLVQVPVARNIYGGVKQLFEAIFLRSHQSRFRRVVLIEYPRKGIYALAFTTGPAIGPIARAMTGPMINCFLPTTPNPTSGFYLVVPEAEVTEVDLSVEEAFKLIMSAGLVAPDETGATAIPTVDPQTLPAPATAAKS